MSKREKLPAALQRSITTTYYCAKCGLHQGEFHHIVSVVDGGADETDNLIILCTLCHQEWHWFAEGHINFVYWLRLPPIPYLVQALAVTQHMHRTLSVHDWLQMTGMQLAQLATQRQRDMAITFVVWQIPRYAKTAWVRVHLTIDRTMTLCGDPIPMADNVLALVYGDAALEHNVICKACQRSRRVPIQPADYPIPE
jgi:hypothetical protein